MTGPRSGSPEERLLREQLAARLRLLRSFTEVPLGLPVAPVAAPPQRRPPTAETPTETLAEVRGDLGDCQRCPLAGGRRHIVFGVGDEDADLMFVGEGPGEEEDRRGEPFVGKAGQLLTRIVEGAFGKTRAEVYIANVVKCRPPNNRDPAPEEIAACLPFLKRQIASVRPRVLVVLGAVAAKTLLPGVRSIGAARGRLHDFDGIPVVATYHPAYLIRASGDPLLQLKRKVWDDCKLALRILNPD